MKATVIIPNYNGMRFLPDCIESLRREPGCAGEENGTTASVASSEASNNADAATDEVNGTKTVRKRVQTSSGTDVVFDILVVDNGSSDGSLEWLKANHVPTLALPENQGFAGGVNRGIEACDSEYVILLNNDTVVLPGFVKNLIATIERSDKLFSVGAMMIRADDHTRLDSAGDGLTVLGWAYQRGIDQDVTMYLSERDVFATCAGAAIYRRRVLDEIGLFDEMHFAYLEDIDICYRARLAGYFSRYCPTARVYHLGSATSGSKYNPFKVHISARNNVYLMYKNQPDLQLMLNAPALAVGCLVKAVFFWKKGFLKDYLGGLKEGFANIDKCRRAPKARHGLITYAAVQWELLMYTFEYCKAYLERNTL